MALVAQWCVALTGRKQAAIIRLFCCGEALAVRGDVDGVMRVVQVEVKFNLEGQYWSEKSCQQRMRCLLSSSIEAMWRRFPSYIM